VPDSRLLIKLRILQIGREPIEVLPQEMIQRQFPFKQRHGGFLSSWLKAASYFGSAIWEG
jgi:hypothetical protein